MCEHIYSKFQVQILLSYYIYLLYSCDFFFQSQRKWFVFHWVKRLTYWSVHNLAFILLTMIKEKNKKIISAFPFVLLLLFRFCLLLVSLCQLVACLCKCLLVFLAGFEWLLHAAALCLFCCGVAAALYFVDVCPDLICLLP